MARGYIPKADKSTAPKGARVVKQDPNKAEAKAKAGPKASAKAKAKAKNKANPKDSEDQPAAKRSRR